MTDAGEATTVDADQTISYRVSVPAPDLARLTRWMRRHAVLLVALALIIAQLVWKAQLLGKFYFFWDDFHDLDLAIEHPLTWSYLTYVFDGHLIIGLRVVAWVLARTMLYNWGLACAVTLTFTGAASLACYRALRTLFGNGPRILLLLSFYLLTPLTIATFGWWSSAMESVPLQLATFMAVSAHVQYVRDGRTRHLVEAGSWVAFGLIFFEKALVLPLLLFAITAMFLVKRRTLLDGALRALRQFSRAWAVYLTLMIVYSIVLGAALSSSISQPHAPSSAPRALSLIVDLLKNSFFPGAFGGPWRWYPENSYAIGAPPAILTWLSLLAAVAVVTASLVLRRSAGLAWATLAGWLLLADILPLLLGRVSTIPPALLGLDIRYVADAAPVLTIAIGLAFLPVVGGSSAARRMRLKGETHAKIAQPLKMAAASLAGIIVLGSVWSVQQLGKAVTGAPNRSYIANATEAVRLAPRGITVLNWPVPESIADPIFGRYSHTSAVIGDLAMGKMKWVGRLNGNFDNLYWFGPDGRLYPVWVGPTVSWPRSKNQACWPQQHGTIFVPFVKPTTIYTWILRIGYLSSRSSRITVTYGNSVKPLAVLRGLHTAYLQVRGGHVTSITLAGLGATRICVGDVEAGYPRSSPFGKPIP